MERNTETLSEITIVAMVKVLSKLSAHPTPIKALTERLKGYHFDLEDVHSTLSPLYMLGFARKEASGICLTDAGEVYLNRHHHRLQEFPEFPSVKKAILLAVQQRPMGLTELAELLVLDDAVTRSYIRTLLDNNLLGRAGSGSQKDPFMYRALSAEEQSEEQQILEGKVREVIEGTPGVTVRAICQQIGFNRRTPIRQIEKVVKALQADGLVVAERSSTRNKLLFYPTRQEAAD
ncbi:hypothetical protein [Deinococcus misasensis]|uniref:hypothetical protein n=1 Tax=Deinococcus misasensis TaxID=392413 RepID=UPI0005596564|nr:hypothetical protein [Deinococcus misasensis]